MNSIIPPSTKRVELHTSKKSNCVIREVTLENIEHIINSTKNNTEITERVEELNKEWDTERVLEANAAVFTLLSIVLGFLFSYYWFAFAGFISFFLLVHAVQGWCPPLPLIRKLGVRTPTEIYNEKTSIKLIRGDFQRVKTDSAVKVLRVVENNFSYFYPDFMIKRTEYLYTLFLIINLILLHCNVFYLLVFKCNEYYFAIIHVKCSCFIIYIIQIRNDV